MPAPSVSVLAYDGMSVFETGIVTEVFGLPRPEFDVEWYELAVCSEEPGPVRVLGGASLQTPYGLDAFAAAETVIVPGVPDVTADPSPRLVAALRQAHARGARVMSICSGAFALAGLDLCLHLVRRDFGAAIANAVARRLVIQPHRDGGQAQFIEAPMPADPGDDRIAESMTWALAHLAEPITAETLARQAHMSTRTYLRHFTRAAGTTPIRWLINQRIQASLALLETTDAPVEAIARAAGFDTAVTYRHHFAQAMRTSPSAYRRAFHPGQSAGSGRRAAPPPGP